MSAPFNPFHGRNDFTGPARYGFAITPDDNVKLTAIPRMVYVGGTGNLTVILDGDPQYGTSLATGAQTVPITLNNVQGGTWLPIAPHYVLATGTTATGIVGML